jgi:hypothetical protein
VDRRLKFACGDIPRKLRCRSISSTIFAHLLRRAGTEAFLRADAAIASSVCSNYVGWELKIVALLNRLAGGREERGRTVLTERRRGVEGPADRPQGDSSQTATRLSPALA